MSHPTNKHQRFIIGQKKGKRRAFHVWKSNLQETLAKYAGLIEQNERQLRDHTTLCNCSMCHGHKEWLRSRPTLQELRVRDRTNDEIQLFVESKASKASKAPVECNDINAPAKHLSFTLNI